MFNNKIRQADEVRTEVPESTPCPTLTTLPVFLKHSLLVLDTYEAAVHVCRGLSADGV